MNKKVCVIAGVGPGNGAAMAERFAKAGYSVALLARTPLFAEELAARIGEAHAYKCDVTDGDSVKNVFQEIRREQGEIDVVIYNAGSGAWGNVEEINSTVLESSWRVNTLGLLLVSQEVIPSMKQGRHGSIIVIGATASRRGGVRTAAFAPAKAAQRSLAESMAKYLWPHGIHVAVIIIDGVVDLPETRARLPEKSDDFFVKPSAVAETAYWLTQQPSSAWSFEVEARPFGENW
ncbi:Diacetyl reductase [(S)-acetoin forming] [Aquicella siphonis]|uniref:Diacetyl reductase [(S)-acetoin forming] n=1 Tax=Aquicella siphonis TaxID=254247 RepID=A0A5E4PDG7_9COXI|nr:SDR family NAD(P)-dependent oxidoreductase [Aquicella siphonis]VVC74969.1 Diacetyl reductase [(S)-acetoin forming] [Aquicella siphonis]